MQGVGIKHTHSERCGERGGGEGEGGTALLYLGWDPALELMVPLPKKRLQIMFILKNVFSGN